MKRLLIELICLITVSILCLLLPNQNNYLDGSWITHITGISSTILLSIKIFLMKPLFWGILCFFLLRYEDVRFLHYEIQPQIDGKLCIVMRIVTIVLTAVLLYWTWGFVRFIVLPPMPLRLGYYIMNHRIVLCISWCVVAITGYLSLKKRK